jgi:4-hydroxy-2-oxoheptanedioate aldolase
MFRPNRLKQRIQAGEKSLGTWLESASPALAEVAAISGLDFFIIDQEHGPGGLQTAIDMMRAGACTQATAVVRVPPQDVVYVRRLVEAGMEAILVPMVETAEQARAIVSVCRFPPRGSRGDAACVTRSSSYGFAADYYDRADDNLLIMVQIETYAAVKNAREIAEVDGVDLVFIGPGDLSGSSGLRGKTNAPEVEALIAEIVQVCKRAGKPLGTVPRLGKSWQQLVDNGFSLVATGSDIAIYNAALTKLVNERDAYVLQSS